MSFALVLEKNLSVSICALKGQSIETINQGLKKLGKRCR
jgi:hypothetical protein